MTLEEILKNLCVYDERSPYYDPDNPKKDGSCFCDMCFYGRHVLAVELLKHREEP